MTGNFRCCTRQDLLARFYREFCHGICPTSLISPSVKGPRGSGMLDTEREVRRDTERHYRGEKISLYVVW